MTNHIPVVFCCDKKYAPYAAVASYSLCRHSKSGLKLIWMVPASDLNDIRPIVNQMTKMGIGPKVVVVPEDRFDGWDTREYISLASYIRLLIPDFLDEEKVIYLDCDTLVLDDLKPLFALDMQGCSIAGVEDLSGRKDILVPLPTAATYINSGVLLMDLGMLRKDDFFKKCQHIYAEHSEKLRWMDQCVINCYLQGNVQLLDGHWNCQILPNWTVPEKRQAILRHTKPAIMHFLGAVKPWQAWCNPVIAKYWWQYANDSGLSPLPKVPVTHLGQSIELARVLDMNEDFLAASQLKDTIINQLMNKN